MLKRVLVLTIFVLALSGCSKAVPAAENTATSATVAAPTLETFPSLPALTPTSSASPTPFTPFTVSPAVDNLNVRMNPGYLFDAWIMVQQTDTVTVLGKAPGGEWMAIQTEDGVEGWIFTQLLKSDVNLDQVPVRQPKDVVLIQGRVLDEAGTPIQGVGFDITQGTETDAVTNTVVTDANGDFYSFLPPESSGSWTVTQTAIACESNVWADSTCTTYKDGYTGTVFPQMLTVSLPQSSPLAFTWK